MKNLTYTLILCLGLVACDTGTKNQQAATPDTPKDATLAQLSAQIKEEPDVAEHYFLRARYQVEMTQYDGAIADLVKAISLDSSQVEYYNLLSDTYLSYQKPAPAMRTLQKAVRLFPASVPARLKLAQLFIILERYDAALFQLDQALKSAPRDEQIFFLKGMALESKGEIAQAAEAYLTSAEINPDDSDAWLSVGRLLDENEDARAEQYLRNAIEVDSNNLEAWLALGNHYYTMGKMEDALNTYDLIIRKDRQYADAHLNAGLVLLDMEEYVEAKDRFYKAIIMDPLNANAYYFRGVATEKTGDIEAAARDYQNALNLTDDERSKEALIRLGFATKQ